MPLLRFISRFDANHRLLFALSVAGLAYAILPATPVGPFRFAIVWVTFALTMLSLIWTTIVLVHPRDLPKYSRIQDSSRTLILVLVVAAAMASLFAVVALLSNMKVAERAANVLLAGLLVSSSWALIHSIFTLRYAHLYYGNNPKQKRPGGLDFPDEPEPDYLDFAYFAFIIGMTSQTADVNIQAKSIRRTALVQGILAFGFNVVIIALTISGLSSLL